MALRDAQSRGHDVRGATAYVTLEPCSHHGRTGPCADALIAARIARCVVATVDPNPLVRGQGIARLRAAGIAVDVLDPESPLAIEARRLNDAFACSIQHGRPFVTLKAAVSLDGKLAPAASARTQRAPHWLTGPAARADAQQLRHRADALLTGVGTLLADDPSLTDRSGLPRRRPLLRVVLDSALRTPPESKVFGPAANDLLLFTSQSASADAEHVLQQRGAEVVRVPSGASGRLDLHAVLQTLHRREIRSVLLEGGAAINGAFLGLGLVDRVVLYFSESELGLDAVAFADAQPSPYTLLTQLSAVDRRPFAHAAGSSTEDVRITGYLQDPWASVLIPNP
jgi:diaminohydroxyphosphoribosylaminopyrimidine deaminase/5-amino-6-(5-phosphoribosylamino)uracil reductase